MPMCYLLKLLVLTFLDNIHVNQTRRINMEFLEGGLLKLVPKILRVVH